jgi:hypothetical protein
MPNYSGARSAIPQSIFEKYIVKKLRKDNPFLTTVKNESNRVKEGSLVFIPNAGNSPAVVVNRGTFPAVATQRADTNVIYALDVHTTDPTHVTWHEENEISYDKTDDVLADHVATLTDNAADWILYRWLVGIQESAGAYVNVQLPAANIFRTSGATTPVNPNDGQTTNRKAFIAEDVAKLQASFNKKNVPKQGRYLIVESYMYQQLIASLDASVLAAYQNTARLDEGIVGRLYGFDIYERSSVVNFNAAATSILLPGQAMAATDNIAAIAYQKQSVTMALGDIKPFGSMDDPLYYGDVHSALIKCGGRCSRSDWAGLAVVVQE